MVGDSWRREVRGHFESVEPVWHEAGDWVAGGPLLRAGHYIPPVCDEACCDPYGPFDTDEDARAWARVEARDDAEPDFPSPSQPHQRPVVWPSAPKRMIAVIGASGRSGRALMDALDGAVPIVRDAKRWPDDDARIADITDATALRAALADATVVISTAHARHAAAVIAAAPPEARLIFLGSTRRFSRWPDAHGDGVRAGEAAFLASGRAGVMLHPTMIYGAEGEDNVQRLAALMRRLPVLPLPGGGRALVQPIHQSDVTRAVLAALGRGQGAITIAGPEALPYADFCAAVAGAAAVRPRPVIPISAALLIAAAPLTALPGLPRIRPAEIRRLTEDKAFDIGAMRNVLGVEPLTLAEGLRRTFRSR